MMGIFASSPRTLADAIRPIDTLCEQFDWAVSLQSGPFREIHFTEEDDPRNALGLFHEFSECEPFWFRRGLLPRHASNLIFDEWSCYLGFDANDVNPHTFHTLLNGDISPRPQLFDAVAVTPCIYLIFVDDGWWEAYSVIDGVESLLKKAWKGRSVYSNRWDGRHHDLHPFPEIAK